MANEQDPFSMHSTGSANSSRPQARQAITSQDPAAQNRSKLQRTEWIRHCAQTVLASYRRDDFADPDNYVIQLGMVIERYPDAIIKQATSPVTGIQRTCKFPPSIAEVVEFCNEMQRRSNYASNWNARAKKQLDERDAYDAETKTESLEHRKAVVARIKAELAAKGMHILQEPHEKEAQKASTFRRFSDDELRKLYPPKPEA